MQFDEAVDQLLGGRRAALNGVVGGWHLGANHFAVAAGHQVEGRTDDRGIFANSDRLRDARLSVQRRDEAVLAHNVVRGGEQRAAWRPAEHPAVFAAGHKERFVRKASDVLLDFDRAGVSFGMGIDEAFERGNVDQLVQL